MSEATTFTHYQSAHCESGVSASMLRHHGFPVSEAMVFGLSSALSFAFLPFIKINQLPLIAYRMPPRFIVNGLRKLLQLPMKFETFGNAEAGMKRLDQLLAEGRVVGLQTSVFFLPYFPPSMRFHFNAHNLMVIGKEGDDYLISDPVFENVTRCASADLQRARFVRGVLAPKGLLYFLDGEPGKTIDREMVLKALKKTCRIMLYTPVSFIGASGVKSLAKALKKISSKKDEAYIKRYIGHVIRMQEEIGTGGAGFRFLYAAFLQEAGQQFNLPELKTFSARLTAIGDEWREFAVKAARMSKGRLKLNVSELIGFLENLSAAEDQFFRDLYAYVKAQ